jgi:signal transduction histidine kinase
MMPMAHHQLNDIQRQAKEQELQQRQQNNEALQALRKDQTLSEAVAEMRRQFHNLRRRRFNLN